MDNRGKITQINGVGAVREKNYAKLGIKTVSDLLFHFPRGYEDRANIKLLGETLAGEKSSTVLVVATQPRVYTVRRGMSLLKFRAYDDSGSCEITFFNQNFLKNSFVCGNEYRFFGEVERKGNKFFMSSPDFEEVKEDTELTPLVPVYPLTEGISRKQISKDVKSVIENTSVCNSIIDPLPEEVRIKNRLCTLGFALRNIHFPTDYVSLAIAKKRLIYDEFLTFALGLSIEGRKNRQRSAFACTNTDIAPILNKLPYELTDAQKRVCAEIAKDMSSSTAMSRMIVGDVGCGKTVCAAIAIYIAVNNGKQAALMVPTEILARQHYADLEPLFSSLGIRTELLCGSVTLARKRKIQDELSLGETDVVIGTHALISEGVSFARAGLVVTDEQHRFGVSQRGVLTDRNEDAHMLVMSATPIPRSLALSMYGDLDVSKIDQMPPGRQRVDTFAVDESYRERLDAFIKKQVDSGGQVYIVCPSIEENDEDVDERALKLDDIDFDGNVISQDKPKLKAAIPYANELKKRLGGIKIAFIHGKMKTDEKDAVMLDFAAGKTDVLVSTTVIEVGVNVPNASLMIVENAERFGLSQLHQLRGRVGRGGRKSYCVLVSQSAGKQSTAGERLKTMCSTYNGYEIAEKDLVMRGPGDFVKATQNDRVRQSGGVKFRLADLCDDTGLLKLAFSDAAELIAKSPDLAMYEGLKEEVDGMFSLGSASIS